MKTEVYNLIILDESGSMSGVQFQTISGCNETLNTIRSAQKEFAETQDQLVSVYCFQSNGSKPSRYLIKNSPISAAKDINPELYQPWGSTPLYDAIGSTLADLKAVIAGREMAIANVTIITDGMENSSETYTHQKVVQMITELKEKGWNFNFIGANIDVARVSKSLNIDNHLAFVQDEDGMRDMFVKERRARMQYCKRTNDVMMDEDIKGKSFGEIMHNLKKAAKDYFN